MNFVEWIILCIVVVDVIAGASKSNHMAAVSPLSIESTVDDVHQRFLDLNLPKVAQAFKG